MVCWFTVIASSHTDLTPWILKKVPSLCGWDISAWKLLCVQKVNDYRFRSLMWKWAWASVVLQLLLLHLFSTTSSYEMSSCLPTCKTVFTYYCAGRQMRRNHNHHFCHRSLSFVNNTESILDSPKDTVVCKTAFHLTSSRARARCIVSVAGGGVWRLACALWTTQGQEWKGCFI